MSTAATSFCDCPPWTASHVTVARQANTAVRNPVVASAALRAHPWPRRMRTPHAMESAPNVPPERRAVFALSGFDRNPITPTAMRNAP
jgi:hypothetical protein